MQFHAPRFARDHRRQVNDVVEHGKAGIAEQLGQVLAEYLQPQVRRVVKIPISHGSSLSRLTPGVNQNRRLDPFGTGNPGAASKSLKHLRRYMTGMFIKTLTLTVALLMLSAAPASLLNDPSNPVQLRAGTEIGFVKLLSHKIQLGENGTLFDYVHEGGQENLYPFSRLSLDLGIHNRHTVTFLYQPLDVRTQALLLRDVTVDSLVFPAMTPMNLRYFFDFYRLSYLYDFLPAAEKEFSVGLSLQFRDASISFASQDGKLFRITQNVGPVPILKARLHLPFGRQSFIGAEVDGFYASDKIFNGANFKFEGSILDASLRYGLKFSDALTGFINLRYLGGNAKGQGYNTPGPSDGYTDNALGTGALTIGFYLN